MKDYSFGNEKYKGQFILRYEIINNQIHVYYANGNKKIINYTEENVKMIENKMREQIQAASIAIKNTVVDYSKTDLIEYIKLYVMIKLKERDIKKNQLFEEYIDFINESYANKNLSWIRKIKDASARDKLVWEIGFHRQKKSLSLSDADQFSYAEVEAIVTAFKKYGDYPYEKEMEMER